MPKTPKERVTQAFNEWIALAIADNEGVTHAIAHADDLVRRLERQIEEAEEEAVLEDRKNHVRLV